MVLLILHEFVFQLMVLMIQKNPPTQEKLLQYIEDDEFTIAPLLEDIKDQLTPDVAIMAATDRVAISLLVEMASLGIRPGVDVGIAACDRTRWTQSHWPTLSCVDVQRFELGTQAADMIVSIIKSPKHTCKSKTIKWGWHEGKTLPAVK